LIFDNGDNSGLTNFTDVTPAGAQDNFGGGARADYKVMGDWADNSDLTGIQAKKDFLDIGAGVHYSQGATVLPVGRPSSSTVRWDIDAQYTVAKKFVLYGAFLGDYIGANSTAAGKHERTDTGGLIEGGYSLTPAWELVARYDVTNFDNSFKVAGRQFFQEAGLGVNWFLGDEGSFGNHAKVTVDCDYLPDGTPALTGLDYLASPAGRDAVALRAQFQLWF
jgi:hypothetical protein